MKKNLYKALAVVLSASLIAGAGATYYVRAEKSDEDAASGILSYVQKKDYEAQLFQDETVYVINNNDGDTQKMIVVDKLKDNEAGTDTVTKKQLNSETPVEVKVTYTLDGIEVKAADLAGKSGHVTITYDYTNKQYETVNIAGNDEKVYVPFIAVTGMLLNNDKFSNITVDGGRLVDDGSRKAVVGVAFPGLLESLGNAEKITDTVKITDKLVIEADVTDFELGTVYTLVTNYNFDEFEIDENGLEGSLTDAMKTATDAFDQLVDGSAQLYDGLVTAKDGSAALVDGAEAAYEGSKKLSEGASAVDAGAGQISAGLNDAYAGSKQLNDGTAQLTAGLDTLSGNSAAIVAGAEQVFVSLLSNATKGLTDAGAAVPELTIENYSAVLDGVIAELAKTDAEAIAKAKVTAAVEANRAMIEAQVAAAVQAQTGAPDEMMASEQMKAVVAQKTEEQIAALIEQNMASEEVQAQIKAGKAQAEAGAAQIKGVKKSLDDYNTFYQGVKAYTAGVDQADRGAAQLSNGTKTLYAGLGQLNDGAKTLSTGTTELSKGAADLSEGLGQLEAGQKELDEGLVQLRDGAEALNEGLNLVNDELIGRLEKLVDTDLVDITDRLKALKQVSEDYKCVDSLNSAEDGAVKFIYKNEAIK